MRIGWFVLTRDPVVASVRYRCYHMAWALSQSGVESVVYANAAHLIDDLPALDAVIVVKRLDSTVIDVAAAARDLAKPVLFDICDDVLSPDYRSNRRELNRAVFRAVKPLLAAVITTGPALTERLRFREENLPLVLEAPDMAETRELLEAVTAFAAAAPTRAPREPAPEPLAPRPVSLALRSARALRRARQLIAGVDRTAPQFMAAVSTSAPPTATQRKASRRIVWFGNHGAPHSNFGILSLLSAAEALRRVNADMPTELVVISNDEQKFDAFIPQIGVPATYVRWTAETVYEELARADVALLTSGDDPFSEVKSPNRALQALACGVPVVASSSPALRDLGDCVVLDDFEAGLRLYLGDRRARQAAVAKARSIIKKQFSPEAVSAVLAQGLARMTSAQPSRRLGDPPCAMFLIEAPGDIQAVVPLIDQARGRGLEVRVLVGDTATPSAELTEMLISRRLIPTTVTGAAIAASALTLGDARLLRDADWLVTASGNDGDRPIAKAMRRLACANGVTAFEGRLPES